MEFDLLKAFCQLAKSGNYRLASEQLYITQSALTKRFNDLNPTLGRVYSLVAEMAPN